MRKLNLLFAFLPVGLSLHLEAQQNQRNAAPSAFLHLKDKQYVKTLARVKTGR